ncbi:MAG: ATP-binding domain-containing protein, partial [Betaproteobacteria bacterium]
GVVLAPQGSAPSVVWMAGQEPRSVGVSRLPPQEVAYATTVHKSQGSEFDRVALVLPDSDHPVLCRELLYTGLTRARRDLLWFLPNPSLLGAAASRTTQRMGGLWSRLDALRRPDGA